MGANGGGRVGMGEIVVGGGLLGGRYEKVLRVVLMETCRGDVKGGWLGGRECVNAQSVKEVVKR